MLTCRETFHTNRIQREFFGSVATIYPAKARWAAVEIKRPAPYRRLDEKGWRRADSVMLQAAPNGPLRAFLFGYEGETMPAETLPVVRPIASSAGLELAYPNNEPGLGAVILSPESPELISGVRVQSFPIFPDDRGYFLEVQRIGRGLNSAFPPESTQISAALNFPGTIKAFHYHLQQTDCWTPAKGMFQVALVDLRLNSSTFGKRNTLYVGSLRPWHLLIPPGVAHGYKVIGTDEALLVYLTDRFYNPRDEGRIPYDDSSIGYDWETQRK